MDALKVIYDEFGYQFLSAIREKWSQVNEKTDVRPMDLIPVLNEIGEPTGKHRIPREINFDFHGTRGTVQVERFAMRNMGEEVDLFAAYLPIVDRLYWHKVVFTADSGDKAEE